MKLIFGLVVGSISKTLTREYHSEINCDFNELNIPKNSNGWTCSSAQNDLSEIAWCQLDCDVRFQIKPG